MAKSFYDRLRDRAGKAILKAAKKGIMGARSRMSEVSPKQIAKWRKKDKTGVSQAVKAAKSVRDKAAKSAKGKKRKKEAGSYFAGTLASKAYRAGQSLGRHLSKRKPMDERRA